MFLRDRRTGTTERVSVTNDEEQADGESTAAAISANGRFVVFESGATNLSDTQDTNEVADPGDGHQVAFDSEAGDLVEDDTNGRFDVFVHDLITGETTRASVTAAGDQADLASLAPAISRTGDVVGCQSGAKNLVAGDTNDAADVFVRVT